MVLDSTGPDPMVPHMDVVVVGAGEVGQHLADVLSRADHRVTIVDRDPAKCARLTESMDAQVVVGDGARTAVLNQAGVSKADILIAVTNDDHVNMLACLSGRHLGARRIVLRLKDITLLEGYRYFYKRALGFDLVLCTDDLAAEEITDVVREHHALEVESFAHGRVQMRRLRVGADTDLTSGPIKETRIPSGVLIVAVTRGKEIFVPDKATKLTPEDQILVVGRPRDLDRFEEFTGHPRLGHRSVVIMGGGGVGRLVARKLEKMPDVSVRLIERDPERAKELASEFSSAVMILVGDSTDLSLLQEERMGEANVFIATTGEDERNMVACQLARSMGVERTMAMVNKADYQHIYDLLNIDNAVAPRTLLTNQVMRYVRAASVSSLSVLSGGKAEILELEVRFQDGRTEHKVRDLGLPPDARVAAIVRDEGIVVPEGDTVVHKGEQLIIFTLAGSVGDVEDAFRASDGLRND